VGLWGLGSTLLSLSLSLCVFYWWNVCGSLSVPKLLHGVKFVDRERRRALYKPIWKYIYIDPIALSSNFVITWSVMWLVDSGRSGQIWAVSLKIALVLLCNADYEDKYRCTYVSDLVCTFTDSNWVEIKLELQYHNMVKIRHKFRLLMGVVIIVGDFVVEICCWSLCKHRDTQTKVCLSVCLPVCLLDNSWSSAWIPVKLGLLRICTGLRAFIAFPFLFIHCC